VPELPDVEGYRIALAGALPGRTVRRVRVADAGVLRNTSARALQRALRGEKFRAPRRHGKWLLLPTGTRTLLVHSGMTGRPYYTASGNDHQERFDRVSLELDRGEFRYNDLRKLRGLWLADTPESVDRIIGESGPDALGLDTSLLSDLLTGRRRRLKPALMDQSVIAGLGNLLVDEIAWQARIAPTRRCTDLADDDMRALGTAMRRVLRTSIRHRCVPSLRSWLTGSRDDRGTPCPRCGTPLRDRRMNGRRTVWCERCQPR
jgi:formamidopyrimidine-DNA glycosylase